MFAKSAALGWAAAFLSCMTAYIRTLGSSAGTPQYFIGPMAKQQRMFGMTMAYLIEALFWGPVMQDPGTVIYYTLWIIIVGAIFTCIRRTLAIVNHLENSSTSL